MRIKVRGPKLNAQTPLWEATSVEIVEWKEDKGHFHDHRTIRHLFLARELSDETILNKGTSGQRQMLLPGTMLALCRIKEISVNFGGESFRWRETDDKTCHALLLLQTEPENWRQGISPNQSLKIPDCVCLGGEIDLSLLATGDEARLKEKIKQATKINQTVNSQVENAEGFKLASSGMAFVGDCRFEWQQDDRTINAPFWATPFYSGGEISSPAQNPLYLALDRELMNSERKKWNESLERLNGRFQELAGLLRQKFSAADARIYWANLEPTSQTGVPQFHWKISASENQTILNFERGEWQIVIADQAPGEADVTPRSILTLTPKLKVKKTAESSIVVSFEDRPEPTAAGQENGKLRLTAVKNFQSARWSETIEISEVTTEYESLSAAGTLRRQYGLTATTDDGVEAHSAEPEILWGFMPLADGWAQLPLLNLSEQNYFDALPQVTREADEENQPPAAPPSLLVGAASFGNDAPETFLPDEGENPWSVTLLSGAGYRGEWVIKPNQENPPKLELERRTMEIFSPDIILNGFFLLGTETPQAADLLPSLDDFLSKLVQFSLRTTRGAAADDKFPAPFLLHFNQIEFENREAKRDAGMIQEKKFSAPLLKNWQFVYRINDFQIGGKTIFEKLLLEGLWRNLSDNERAERFENLWRHLPLVWRRHPTAPLIQALPLTQTQTPPSHPSPSRQLAPFQVSVEENSHGENYAVFGVDARTGAKGWARWFAPQQQIKPSLEWNDARFLWLAALGFPGLIFDPRTRRGLFESDDDFLPAQLLYGLPYTDEINALAQLPKDEPNAQIAPPQNTSLAKPALAPRREHFASHWRTLAEKAALAKPDADEMLNTNDGKTVVQNLIEPFEWKVAAKLEIAEYPGKVTLIDDYDNDNYIELTGNLPEVPAPGAHEKISALKGIGGKFELVENRLLRLNETAANRFEIVAGMMTAHGEGDARLRDQRGLARGATLPLPDAQTPRLLKTALVRQQTASEEKSFTLFTLMKPLELKFGGGNRTWRFWFRDLPVFSDKSFSRRKTRKVEKIGTPNHNEQYAQDVNDPAATSSEFNFLASYEWRLSEQNQADEEIERKQSFLNLLGFRFFPLTLEKIVFDNTDRAQSIEIIGRLELPVGAETATAETPEAGNAVRVIFKRAGDLLQLDSITSNLDDIAAAPNTGGIWTLNPQTEFFPARIHWMTFDYSASDGKIRLAASLEFYLFDSRWFEPLTIEPFAPGNQEIPMTFKAAQSNQEIRLAEIALKLGAGLKPKELQVAIEFDWGGSAGAALPAGAVAKYDLLKDDLAANPNKLVSLDFFWKLTAAPGGADTERIYLKTNTERCSLASGALQIEFSGFRDDFQPEELQLLPAMSLDGKNSCAGFAVASFEIIPKGSNSSDFRMKYGGAEAVFACHWGEKGLPTSGEAVNVKQIFGSSRGDLSAGYTLSRGKNGVWKPSLLLNGIIEVKNLISYPSLPVAELPDELRKPILFALGSDDLDDAAKRLVKNLFDFIYLKPDLYLTLEGHADDIGGHDHNLGKSEARAKAVRKEILRLAEKRLEDSGLDENVIEDELESLKKRLVAVGFGETMPREPNDSAEGSANNRRVEIHVSLGFLPPVRPSGAENIAPLNHVRHTLRVLLNQHEVPPNALSRGTKTLFFNFANGAAWQFLAVVEHRLADVVFGSALSVQPQIGNDRRWTAVQEVRFASPKMFSDFLAEFFHPPNSTPDRNRIYTTFPAHKGTGAEELTRVSAAFFYKPLLRELLKVNSVGKNEITKLENALLVEASAIQQVLSRPNDSADFTNLQYLPRGVQRAILSIPEDFAMPAPGKNQPPGNWLLLSLPFLGRLQNPANDFLDAEIPPQTSALAVDPIWFLYKKRAAAPPLHPIPLAFASRGDKEKIEIEISHFDLTRFRRFKRLDQVTLLESWFRLQHPPKDDDRTTAEDEGKLKSVTAALPADSPARASRQKMLRRLFDERRVSFPPTTVGELFNDDPPTAGKLQWRRKSLLTLNGFSDLVKHQLDDDGEDDAPVLTRPYSFYFAAAQIHSCGLQPASGATDKTARFAAVTLLPANLRVGGSKNEMPVGFAVSPYLGFDFDDFKTDETDVFPSLVFADLLCLDNTGEKPVSIASRIWLREELSANVEEQLKVWGEEIKNRLAADSPLAMLRIREAFAAELSDNTRAVKIVYKFLAISSPPQFSSPTLIAGSSPLRLSPEKLRFAEGQFAGNKMPPAFAPFEVAPPQVRGVQPIYFEPEVWNKVKDTLGEKKDRWNWGLSAIRFVLRFTERKTGIVGATDLEQDRRLWWVAFSHQVQFAQPPQIGKLLPEKFRARQIKSMLPVLTGAPVPPDLGKVFDEIGSTTKSGKFDYWQPVLPGALSYMLVGARAGVPFAFRHLLLTQKLKADNSDRNDGIAAIVASGVPVQHRFPRPVALPKNPTVLEESAPTEALQTWASYFEPQKTLLVLPNPHDNAFVVKEKNESHGLKVVLASPRDGIVSSDSDGKFCLEISGQAAAEQLSNWKISVELSEGNKKLRLNPAQTTVSRKCCFVPEGADESGEKAAEILRQFLAGLPHGAELKLTAAVIPPAAIVENISNYSQRLVFPLRLADANRIRNPFRYNYVQFEDPEYNRKLISQAAQVSRAVVFKQDDVEKTVEMTLAADRREYNASSDLLAAYFNKSQPSGKVTIKRVDADGLISTLSQAEVFTPEQEDEAFAAFKVFSLSDLQKRANVRLVPGDSLLISLQPDPIAGQEKAPDPLELRVEIVSEPVTPVSTSGYALLRRERNKTAVECVRFAWSPQPARIELLNPTDLKNGIVRRRAVFQWLDTTRFSIDYQYGIQKISSSGSTHFDAFR